jgi:hypothetical protein
VIFPRPFGTWSAVENLSLDATIQTGGSSLGKAAELADVPSGQLMTILTEYDCKAGFKKVSARCCNAKTVELQ